MNTKNNTLPAHLVQPPIVLFAPMVGQTVYMIGSSEPFKVIRVSEREENPCVVTIVVEGDTVFDRFAFNLDLSEPPSFDCELSYLPASPQSKSSMLSYFYPIMEKQTPLTDFPTLGRKVYEVGKHGTWWVKGLQTETGQVIAEGSTSDGYPLEIVRNLSDLSYQPYRVKWATAVSAIYLVIQISMFVLTGYQGLAAVLMILSIGIINHILSYYD